MKCLIPTSMPISEALFLGTTSSSMMQEKKYEPFARVPSNDGHRLDLPNEMPMDLDTDIPYHSDRYPLAVINKFEAIRG